MIRVFLCLLSMVGVGFANDVMRVDVDATQIARHLLRSTVVLPTQPGPFSFRYPEWIPGIHGPSEQIRNIGGLNVFDAKGKTFRDEIYPQYKATRPPMPDR